MISKLKKAAALLMAMAMVTAALPVCAEQADISDDWKNLSETDDVTLMAKGTLYGDYLYYNILDDGTVEISDCNTSATEITIPSTIDGRAVTSIGRSAFKDCSSLTSIEIPDGVISIGIRAFEYCSSLTSIEIPDSVTSIEIRAFSGCSSLTSIEIPYSVTSIRAGAFANCTELTNIVVDSENKYYKVIDNVLISNSGELVQYPVGRKNTTYVIPENVTSIGEMAFMGCSSLTSIEIPYSVTSIGWGAFMGCSSLTSIEIPDSVTSIGERAFSNCI